MADLGNCSGAGSCAKATANDAVCMSATIIDADTTIDLWTNETSFKMNGTIVIENLGTVDGWPVEVLINEGGAFAATYEVEPGETYAVTLNKLSTIQLKGKTGATAVDDTNVKVSFSLNYIY